MRSIAKPFLFSGTILLGIYLLLLLTANLTLQLPRVKDQIRSTLAASLGTSISFESVFLNPAGGINLGKVIVSPTEQLAKASADSLTLYPLWGAVPKGELALQSISMKHPAVTLKLGSSSTPTTQKLPSLVSQTLTATPSTMALNQSSSPTEQPQQPKSEKSTPSPDLASRVPRLLIQRGEFSVLDEGSHPVLRLSDLNAHAENGAMKIMATSAVFADSLILHDISAAAGTEGAFLSLKNIAATMGDGRVTGILRCGLPPESPDYNGTLQLTGASLSKLLANASLASPSTEGQIDGDLTLAGTVGKGVTMMGKGSLRCKEAVIEPVAFLKQIGQLLNVEELKLLKLAEGRCLFRVDQGHVVIDELFLRSENLILSAKGPLQPSGELNLESRLLFNQSLTGRLHGLLGSQLTPAPEAGYSQVTFHVSGPMSNPRTDLIERLTGIHLGGNLGGLGGLLQGLFGRPVPQPQQVPAMPPPAH